MKVNKRIIEKESITTTSLQALKEITRLNEVTEATADVIDELSVMPEQVTDLFDIAMQPFKVGEGILAGKKVVAAVKMIPTRNTYSEVAGDLWKIAKGLQKVPASVEVILKYMISGDPISWTGFVDVPIRTIAAMTTCVSGYQLIRKIEAIWAFEENTAISSSAKGTTRLRQIKHAVAYTKEKQGELQEMKVVPADKNLPQRLDDIAKRLSSRKPAVRGLAAKEACLLLSQLKARIDFQKPADFVDISCKVASTAANLLSLSLQSSALGFAFVEASSAAIQLANYLYVRRCAPQIP